MKNLLQSLCTWRHRDKETEARPLKEHAAQRTSICILLYKEECRMSLKMTSLHQVYTFKLHLTDKMCWHLGRESQSNHTQGGKQAGRHTDECRKDKYVLLQSQIEETIMYPQCNFYQEEHEHGWFDFQGPISILPSPKVQDIFFYDTKASTEIKEVSPQKWMFTSPWQSLLLH